MQVDLPGAAAEHRLRGGDSEAEGEDYVFGHPVLGVGSLREGGVLAAASARGDGSVLC